MGSAGLWAEAVKWCGGLAGGLAPVRAGVGSAR
jgi:hypothetical protein